jgi:ubiquinol-cytochrome c reductase cytochrome c1 subunit
LQLPQRWGTDIRASGGGLAAFIRSYRLQLQQLLQEADASQTPPQQEQHVSPNRNKSGAAEQREAEQATLQQPAEALAAAVASPSAAPAGAGVCEGAVASPADSGRSSLSHIGSSRLSHDDAAAAPAGSLEQAAPAAAEAPADPAAAAAAAEEAAAPPTASADVLGEEASGVLDQQQQQQPGGPTWGVDDYEEEFRQLSDQLQVRRGWRAHTAACVTAVEQLCV